jgi:uncharacterized protein YndB with AHSA1/START domain
MSVTLGDHDGRSLLRFERRLAHPLEKVWRAVTKPEELRHWFPATVAYEPRVGAPMTFSFAEDDPGTLGGQVVELDPPNTFAFLWEGELLRFELTADGPAGCRLVFTHQFDDRPGAASFAAGWTTCLNAMEELLDGHPASASGGWEGMHDLHESFIVAFGLDQGTSQDTPEGWQVRFERQLTRPVADVWACLIDGADRLQSGGHVPRSFVADGLAAGTIVAVEAPGRLEYGWLLDGQARGTVRWTLSDGPGGAARLTVTQTGPRDLPNQRSAAQSAWHAHIEWLATQPQRATP